MKKFENPLMTISMFEVENVVTASGDTPVQPTPQPLAVDAAKAALENAGVAKGDILEF